MSTIIDPQFISLSSKTCSLIRRDSPTDVSTIRIDILYGEEREAIGQATVYRVRLDQIFYDDAWSLLTSVNAHQRLDTITS